MLQSRTIRMILVKVHLSLMEPLQYPTPPPPTPQVRLRHLESLIAGRFLTGDGPGPIRVTNVTATVDPTKTPWGR